VVYNVVNLLAIKLVENGYCHSAIGERGEKGNGPMGGVTAADGYLIALLNIAVLKEYMQFFNFSCDVMILESGSLIVG